MTQKQAPTRRLLAPEVHAGHRGRGRRDDVRESRAGVRPPVVEIAVEPPGRGSDPRRRQDPHDEREWPGGVVGGDQGRPLRRDRQRRTSSLRTRNSRHRPAGPDGGTGNHRQPQSPRADGQSARLPHAAREREFHPGRAGDLRRARVRHPQRRLDHHDRRVPLEPHLRQSRRPAERPLADTRRAGRRRAEQPGVHRDRLHRAFGHQHRGQGDPRGERRHGRASPAQSRAGRNPRAPCSTSGARCSTPRRAGAASSTP